MTHNTTKTPDRNPSVDTDWRGAFAELRHLYKQLLQLRLEQQKMHAEMTSLRKQISILTNDLSYYKSQSKSNFDKFRSAQSTTVDLQHELDALKQTLQTTLDEAQRTENLERALSSTTSERDKLVIQCQELHAMNTEQLSMISSLDSQLSSVTLKCNSLSSEVDLLTNRIQALTLSHTDASTHIDRLRTILQD